MYYLELRFQESNKEKVLICLNNVKLSMEIISSYTATYYICYRLNNPLSKEVYDSLKNDKLFYFISYYKI